MFVCCFSVLFLHECTIVFFFNLIFMCVTSCKSVSFSPVSQHVWGVTECVSLFSISYTMWMTTWYVTQCECHHVGIFIMCFWCFHIWVVIMATQMSACHYIGAITMSECHNMCLSLLHRVWMAPACLSMLELPSCVLMCKHAECESLYVDCHHGYISVFALSQCKIVLCARFELSGVIIISPVSLYVISFELTPCV